MLPSFDESLNGVPILVDSKLAKNESSLYGVFLRCLPLYDFPMTPIPGPTLLNLWSSSCVACVKSSSPMNGLNGY